MEAYQSRTRLLLVGVLTLVIVAGSPLFAEEPTELPRALPENILEGAAFSSLQTYDVFFSLHPQEIDRVSSVRLVGVTALGSRAFLKFQVVLNHQTEEGFIPVESVSAIFPTTDRLVSVPEVLLDRQPLDHEKVKEIRTETVREVIREVPGAAQKSP